MATLQLTIVVPGTSSGPHVRRINAAISKALDDTSGTPRERQEKWVRILMQSIGLRELKAVDIADATAADRALQDSDRSGINDRQDVIKATEQTLIDEYEADWA